MQINIFCLTTAWSSDAATFGLAKRHQKSDGKVSALDYDHRSLICTAEGLSMEGQPDPTPRDVINSPRQTEPSRHSTSVAQLSRTLQMTERLVLSNDQGQVCREKKNVRAGWKGFEHSQGAGESPGRQTLARRVGKMHLSLL